MSSETQRYRRDASLVVQLWLVTLCAVVATAGCDKGTRSEDDARDLVAETVDDGAVVGDLIHDEEDAASDTAPSDGEVLEDVTVADHSEVELHDEAEPSDVADGDAAEPPAPGPIADGWCELVDAAQGLTVECQDGSSMLLPESCAHFIFWELAHRGELYAFAALECTHVDELMIQQVEALPHLRGLETLETVNFLYIFENPELVSLDGLDSLREAQAVVAVYDNPLLTTLGRGLGSLTYVGRGLALLGERLADISSLTSLEVITGDLQLAGAMTTLASLSGVRELGGLIIEDTQLGSLAGLSPERIRFAPTAEPPWLPPPLPHPTFVIRNNPRLADLGTFSERLEPATLRQLEIRDNPSLVSLAGFESIHEVTHGTRIERNTVLQSLDGLGLRGCGTLDVLDNPALVSLGADLAVECGDVTITHSPRLASLSGLESLAAGTVRLEGCHGLADLTGLGALGLDPSSYSDLIVEDCDGLQSLLGLPARTSLDITLRDSESLTSLVGLEQLQVASLHLENLSSLTTLSGFGHQGTTVGTLSLANLPALQTCGTAMAYNGTHFIAESCPQLTTLGCFSGREWMNTLELVDVPLLTVPPSMSNVTQMYNASVVLQNTGLTDLAVFETVRAVRGPMTISHNAALTDLTDLYDFYEIGGPVTVTDNPLLPQCQAEALASEVDLIRGTLTVSGNDTSATCP